MHAIIGVFPNWTAAQGARQALIARGFAGERISLLDSDRMDRAERILTTISHPESRAGSGAIAGLVIGAVIGFIGGMVWFGLPGRETSPYVLGLLGMVPGAVIGGFIGVSLGARTGSIAKNHIKAELINDGAVLFVAETDHRSADQVVGVLQDAGGEYIEDHEIDTLPISKPEDSSV